jgi:transposase
MAAGGEGFMGRCEVVEPRRRGKRHWPDEVKARIVAESLQPGVRVVDVAARHDMPLNRQAVVMARHGVPIDRSVLADWMGRTGALIAPVVDHMAKQLLTGSTRLYPTFPKWPAA